MTRSLFLAVCPLLLLLGCPTETCPIVNSPDCSYPELLWPPADIPVSSGIYTQRLSSASITTDCLPSTIDPVALRTNLEGKTYRLQRQADGSLCMGPDLDAGTGQVFMSCGMIVGNRGTLASRYILTDGTCEWTMDQSINVLVTAENTFSLSVVQQRSNYHSFMAAKCLQVQSCSVSYDATLTAP